MHRTLLLLFPLWLPALGSFFGEDSVSTEHLVRFAIVVGLANISRFVDNLESVGRVSALRGGDGTVLVKEVHGTDHAAMTTGDAHWATDIKVWFVLIKDSKGRYKNNPLWGDGWGWALFRSDSPDKQVATDYKKDCLGCHMPAKADDWIYVKGYPVLHSK